MVCEHTHPRRDGGIGSQKPEMDYDREVRHYLRHESHKGMRLRSCESPGSAAGGTVEPPPPINYYAKQWTRKDKTSRCYTGICPACGRPIGLGVLSLKRQLLYKTRLLGQTWSFLTLLQLLLPRRVSLWQYSRSFPCQRESLQDQTSKIAHCQEPRPTGRRALCKIGTLSNRHFYVFAFSYLTPLKCKASI